MIGDQARSRIPINYWKGLNKREAKYQSIGEKALDKREAKYQSAGE